MIAWACPARNPHMQTHPQNRAAMPSSTASRGSDPLGSGTALAQFMHRRPPSALNGCW